MTLENETAVLNSVNTSLQLLHRGSIALDTHSNYPSIIPAARIKFVQLKYAERKADYLILVRYILFRNKK